MATSLAKKYKLVYKTSFAAAHRIEDYSGRCSSIHGHTYLVEVVVEGSLNSLNMVIDVDVLKKTVEEVISLLDHRYVNEVLNKRNVTMELLASWIMAEVSRRLPF
ncbi:MAG: 6-carboxytetrahydropterin synthase QueD, partial [Ignisphaera sp.]